MDRGELTHDLLSSFGAILIDVSAAALGFVAASLVRPRLRLLGFGAGTETGLCFPIFSKRASSRSGSHAPVGRH